MDNATKDNSGDVSRPQVLDAAAVMGAAAVLAGCGGHGNGGATEGQQGDTAGGKGSELKPLAKPAKFTEAPILGCAGEGRQAAFARGAHAGEPVRHPAPLGEAR
jgi:hypothetical protein